MASFSLEEQFLFTSREFSDSRDYWKNLLEGVNGHSGLFAGAAMYPPQEMVWQADKTMTDRLWNICRQQEKSVYIYVLAVYTLLIHRYTGQSKFVVGISAFKEQQDYHYNEWLPLVVDIRPEATFRDHLLQVKEKVQQAIRHQHYPLSDVCEMPLFDMALICPSLQLKTLTAPDTIPFVIQLDVAAGKQLTLQLKSHVPVSFDVSALCGNFNELLKISLQDTAIPLQSCKPVSDPLQQEMLLRWSAGVPADSKGFRFITQLRTALNSCSDHTAIICKDQRMDYATLGRRVQQAAAYLQQQQHIKPGDRIVLLGERSTALLIGIMAILHAGAVYVPIDISMAADRTRYMLEDVQPALVIADGIIPEGFRGISLALLADLPPLQQAWQPPVITREMTAYIIYTSGSTGNPKGVQVQHGNLDQLFHHICVSFSFHHPPVFPFLASHGFDISLFQIFTPLLQAGTIIVIDKQEMTTPALWLPQCTVLDTVPAVYRLLTAQLEQEGIRELSHIERLFIGGDLIDDGLLYALSGFFPAAIITVLYGPTEGSVFCTCLQYPPGTLLPETRGRCIGRPLLNSRVYILNEQLALLPAGIAGEICVGGGNVTAGYLHQPQLTADRFVPDPYSQGQLYRTGDMACWLPDGSIWFLGRRDGQIKIHGHRIEPGEVENVFQRAPGVKQAVVTVIPAKQDGPRLAAYIVPDEYYSKAILQQWLEQQLPVYMIPSVICCMEHLPLNANGKIDRNALPAPETLIQEQAYQPPRNSTETTLALQWQQLLDLPRIGIYDNVFESGAHSLLAMRMVAAIRHTLHRSVSVRDIFEYPDIAQLAAHIDRLPECLPDNTAVPQTRPAHIPLSFAQERIWFIDQLQGSVQYHMPWIFRITGTPDLAALEHAFRQVIGRHEILRTVIREMNGVAYQEIIGPENWQLQQGVTSVADYISQPFDLQTDYPLRAAVVQLNEQQYRLVVVLHHIAFDGWSTGILVDELAAAYHQPVTKPLPDLQYADYAIWQRQHLQGETLEQQLAYWRNQLADTTVLELPLDYPRPATHDITGNTVTGAIDTATLQQLQQLSSGGGYTLFMTLLAAFKVLLFRYTGQEDICVGTPVAGRVQQAHENLIGCFVNTLALRSHVTAHQGFDVLLQQIRQTTLTAYEHQEVPFEKIVEQLSLSRDMSRHPLFQVMFGLQNLPDTHTPGFAELTVEKEEPGMHTVKFDLSLEIVQSDEGLLFSLHYATALFSADTARQLLDHYIHLLQTIPMDATVEVCRLPLLSEAAQQELFRFSSGPVTDIPATTLPQLFVATAHRFPDATAVTDQHTSLTYKTLDEWSDRLKHYLLQTGADRHTPVAICMPPCVEYIVAIMAILKAGAAYVPVDPTYPDERMVYMLQNSRSAAVIIPEGPVQPVLQHCGLPLITPDAGCYNNENTLPAQPDDIAYIIYTSGTTGQPKGVRIQHRAIVNYITHQSAWFGITAADSIVQTSSFCFDASVERIFLALLNGARLVLCDKDTLLSHEDFEQLLQQQQVTHLHATPGLLKQLIPLTAPHLKRVVAGGEVCSPGLANYWNRYADFYNKYGPTETTVTATEYVCRKGETFNGPQLPIGRPVSNTYVYILDAAGNPVPTGVWGEIHIGGAQVAADYLGEAALTTRRFIPDPFRGGRMYKTGDKGRWGRDGQVYYNGRIDEQVKIRGYRIEPGEVEHVMLQAPDLRQAVVRATNGQLIAWVVTEKTYRQESLMAYLQQHLPSYMIPGIIIPMAALPLTANGKTDYTRLPAPDVLPDHHHVAPRNATESLLANCWQELLGVQRIGVYDNFFSLGGDSIITIQVVSRCRRQGLSITPRDLFAHQTIDALARHLLKKDITHHITGEQGLLEGTFGLLPIQQRFFENNSGNRSHFNQSVLLEIDKSITFEQLQTAFDKLITHHDALRFYYTEGQDGWEQTYGVENMQPDIVTVHPEEDPAAAILRIGRHYQQSLDIFSGKVFRAVWIQLPSASLHHRLLLIAHHLVIDGVSWRILLDDLVYLLEGGADLGPKTASYRQWHTALTAYAHSRELQSQAVYWQHVTDACSPFVFSRAIVNTPVPMTAMDSMTLSLSPAETAQLLQQSDLNALLLSALAFSILDGTDRNSMVVGMEGHGREQLFPTAPDVSETIGWFTTLYPVLLEMPPDAGPRELVNNIRRQWQQLPDKGIGYGVWKYLSGHHPASVPWDIVFNYLGQLDHVMALDKVLRPAMEFAGEQIDPERHVPHKLDITCTVEDGRLHARWGYSRLHFEAAAIREMADKFMHILSVIIDQPSVSIHQHALLLQSGTCPFPVFIIPGIAGTVNLYDELALAMGPDFTVYGLQMEGVLEEEKPLENMMAIAGRLIKWMRDVQPEGPYRLIGHSFGAHILYEMIKQLEATGEEVEQAFILDMLPVLERPAKHACADYLLNHTISLLQQYAIITTPDPQWAGNLRHQLQEVPAHEMVHRVMETLSALLTGSTYRLLQLQLQNLMIRYQPSGKVMAPLTIINGEEGAGKQSVTEWERYTAAAIQLITVPGDHFSMLQEPHVNALATRIKNIITTSKTHELHAL